MRTALIVVMLTIASMQLCGQDSLSLYDKAFNLPDKLFGAIHRKSDKFQQAVLKSTTKYINKLERQEMRMKRKLAKTDSTKAEEVFGDVNNRYSGMREILNKPADKLQKVYSPGIDSMKTSLGFLNKMKVFSESGEMQSKVQGLLKDYSAVQDGLNQADFIQKQLQERREYLMTRLHSFPLGKTFTEFKKNVYYYREQMDEYKRTFEDPAKLESALIGAVVKVRAFNQFFAKYSELGQIFRLPGSDDVGTASLNGMQTRSMLMEELGQRFGGVQNAQGMISNNIASAQNSMNVFKEKLNGLSSKGDADMPDFKPNPEKTKSFLKRLELGTNLQSVKTSYFFPSTTDVGLSLGYKLNAKSSAGIGVSYKLGLGKDFRHMRLSHEGIGLRSFADIKLKGSFWITAGGEWNYRAGFKDFEELKNYRSWQHSAVAGLSKKYQLKKYKGELKVLYDFLWKTQKPAGQPFVFRTGYRF